MLSSSIENSDSYSEQLPSWDLSDLYPSIDSPVIQRDIEDITKRVKAFHDGYVGKIANLSPTALAKAIMAYEQLEESIGKLSSYAQLVYAADMITAKNSAFYQNTSETLNTISTDLLFFELELNHIDPQTMQQAIESSEELQHYAPWIRDIGAYRPHQLNEEVEQILHQKSVTGSQAWNRLFDETIASLKFPYREQQLSCAEILNKLSSNDAISRKLAAKSIGSVFEEHSKIFSFITNILAKDKSIDDNLRQFAQPISSRNVANLIEDEVVDALLHSVKSSYSNLSHRYYKLKAHWFNQTALDYWDRNAPLPQQEERTIPWEEAVEIVQHAYRQFSPELADIGQQFFDNAWIDVPPREGKDSGAFAHPTVPSAHPYLLLNYQGKIRDVMTLAHELGHGVHQCLSASQGALMADTPLTLAETASVFGEQLTFRALLDKESSPEQRKFMIANKVEDMLNTVVRQVAFCEFERQIHDERQQGEIPTERINEIWLSVQQDSLGPAIRFDREYQYYWAYIPHFIHSPFYVYSYAFGDCLVNALYAVYQEQPKGFEEKYLSMLKAGGSKRHKELLKPFGLSASNPDFWQKGLNIISDFIDELEG